MKIAIVLFAISVLACAEDGASVLARILAEKGTISAAELAQVESAAPGEQLKILATLLEQKGVLTSIEVARLYGPPAPSAPQVAVATDGARGNAPTDGAAPQIASNSGPNSVSSDSLTHDPQVPPPLPSTSPGAPVTAQGGFPLSFYGTILFNSF